MVRKWSYLTPNITNNSCSLNLSVKTKSFKVFRQTTKFKKFTRGLTQSVRQKYTQRKFFTSLLVLAQITKWWSLSYIQSKQFSRFIQSMSYAPILSHMPDFNTINLISYSNEAYLSFHNFSCSKKLLYRIFVISNTLFSHHKSTNSKMSLVQTSSYTSLGQNEITYPLDTCFENLTYHPSFHNDSVTVQSREILHDLCKDWFTCNLYIILTYYKTLIHVSLLIMHR